MKYGIEIEFWSPLSINDMNAFLAKKGIQLASNNLSAAPNSLWDLKSDGSLYNGPSKFYGMELVSPILNTDSKEDTKAIKKITKLLQGKGCEVNRSTGFHVHVDASTLDVNDIKRIFTRYTEFEGTIDKFMTYNRRENTCGYSRSGKAILNDVQNAETVSALGRVTNDRYYKINLVALSRHGTIEFRQHSGTINGETITRWVKFLTQFVEASKEVPVVAAPTQNRRGLTPSMQKIMASFLINNSLTISEIATHTDLSPATVKNYLSKLKTEYCVQLTAVGRGEGAIYTINPEYLQSFRRNPNIVSNKVTTRKTTKTVKDSLWRGISKEVIAFYKERAMELNGFCNADCC